MHATPGIKTRSAVGGLCRQRLVASCHALAWLLAASVSGSSGAWAQGGACEKLKGELAARMDLSGVRGYTLEAVPAGTPVPPHAKVIGTCGASKILYRRGGVARPRPDVAQAAQPASDEQAKVVPPVPVAASVPSPVPPPAAPSVEVAAVRASEPASAAPAQVPLDKTVVPEVSLTGQAAEFMAEHRRWMWALLLVPLAGGFWFWRVHRSAYDEAGLPRGPKL
jgi:Protein of unknown function (DUF1161)